MTLHFSSQLLNSNPTSSLTFASLLASDPIPTSPMFVHILSVQTFTLEDDSEEARIVEAKVNALSQRFTQITEVDLAGNEQTVNLLFPVIFGIATLGVVVVVVVSVTRGANQKAVAGARTVFVRFGALKRPTVIGTHVYVT